MKKVKGRYLFSVWSISLLLFGTVLNGIEAVADTTSAQTTDLYISEYVEGSANNKAVEIYNGTNQSVDLSQYTLALYSNGATEATNFLQLSGQLASGAVYVVGHPSAGEEVKKVSNIQSNVVNFSGDDTVALKKQNQVLDSFGVIGKRENWGTDQTFVRKSTVISGKNWVDQFDSSSEWMLNPKDDFSNLGFATNTINEKNETSSSTQSTSSSEQITTSETTDSSEENAIDLHLLSVNDLHGKITEQYTVNNQLLGRADYLATYLRQRKLQYPNSLLVNAGDMIGGSSPTSALFQDEPTVEIMQSLGFDVGTVGNHEFDEGVPELLRMINGGDHPNGNPGYAGMKFPVLAANVSYKDTGDLVLPPYAIKEVQGVKIGFIGVATTATPNMIISKGNENIRFTDEATAINKYTTELQKQGVEAIMVLAHVPGTQSGEGATGEIATLAKKVSSAVDVIFAAHNHVKLNAVVDNKLIVQAWEYGKSFADVDIKLDKKTGDVVKKSAEIVDVVQNNVTPDSQVAAILAKYEAKAGPKLNEIIGQAELEMKGGYAAKGAVGDNALGNLIADGMKASMNSDFALMNGGGIRDNLKAGAITWNDLFNIQPFNNTLVKLEISGSDLREIINSQFSSYGADVSISGFSYTWNSKLGKYGQVIDMYLPNGQKVAPNGKYTVTVNNYMYPHSSDKYLLAKLGENPVQGPEDLTATVDFVRSFKGQAIRYVAEKRISEVSATETSTTAPVEESSSQLPETTATSTEITDSNQNTTTSNETTSGITTETTISTTGADNDSTNTASEATSNIRKQAQTTTDTTSTTRKKIASSNEKESERLLPKTGSKDTSFSVTLIGGFILIMSICGVGYQAKHKK